MPHTWRQERWAPGLGGRFGLPDKWESPHTSLYGAVTSKAAEGFFLSSSHFLNLQI